MAINPLSGPFLTTDLVNQSGRNNPAWMGWFTSVWNRVSSLITQANKTVYGNGTPEGVVTADIGTMYINQVGGSSQTLWIKELGSGNRGWVAK